MPGLNGWSGPTQPVSCGPAMRSPWPLSYCGEIVLADQAGDWVCRFRTTPSGSGPIECTGTQPHFKLFFVHPDRTGDTDHAVGRNFPLSDPEVNSINRDPEPLGNLAYFCKSRRPRHDLVVSSKHGNAAESIAYEEFRFALLRFASRRFALFFGREIFQKRVD